MATTRKLAERVLLHRRQLDLDQDELARRSSIDRSYISAIERQRKQNPTIEVVEALALALGLRPEYLVGWTDDPLGEGNVISSSADGRIVYQVSSPGEYRAIQQLLDIWPELTDDDRRFVIEFAGKLGRASNVRIIE